MDTVQQSPNCDGIWRDDYDDYVIGRMSVDDRNAQAFGINQARLRVATRLNISLDGGRQYIDFCAAWDRAIRRATLSTGEVTTPYPEADIVKGIMDDMNRRYPNATTPQETVTPVTPMAAQEVRRRSIVQELRRDYEPDIDPVAVERAMDEAEGRIEGWQTGGTPTLITVSLVVDIIRELAVPGSLAANLRRLRNVGRVLIDEVQELNEGAYQAPTGHEYDLATTRQAVREELRVHYGPWVLGADVAVQEAIQLAEDTQEELVRLAGATPREITATQVALMVRRSALYGSELASFNRIDPMMTAATNHIDVRLTTDRVGYVPTTEERFGEALIDLVGSTSEEDLAKNAGLSKKRVEEIMHLVSCAIGMRSTNQ